MPTLSSRVTSLIASAALNGAPEPTMIVLGLAEQDELKESLRHIEMRANLWGQPESYHGLVVIRCAAPALLLVGNFTREQTDSVHARSPAPQTAN